MQPVGAAFLILSNLVLTFGLWYDIMDGGGIGSCL